MRNYLKYLNFKIEAMVELGATYRTQMTAIYTVNAGATMELHLTAPVVHIVPFHKGVI